MRKNQNKSENAPFRHGNAGKTCRSAGHRFCVHKVSRGIVSYCVHILIICIFRLGFAAEAYPRYIIRTEVNDTKTGLQRNIFDYTDEQDFYDTVVAFIEELFFKYVLVSPKDRRVVIVESVFCPTVVRDTLARVLFRHFEVASVFFVSTHLNVLTTLAVNTALVVDIGFKEAVIVPVYSGVQVLNAYQAQPLGGEAVHKEIKRQLIEQKVPEEFLTDEVIENIKVRTCFVTPYDRAAKYRSGEAPKPCPDVGYPLKGQLEVKIPGELRETAYEALFPYDNDRQGLPFIILDAILACPIDMRRELAHNLVLVGGTAMTLGLKIRLQLELEALAKSELYKDRLFIDGFKFHSPPSKANTTSWLGGAIYGGTELILTKSLTKENYARLNRVPDWSNLEDNNRYLG